MIKKRGCVNRRTSTNYLLDSRKGQVTVFIIIGIIVVFAFAGIMFITKTTTTSSIEGELIPTSSTVPQEFKPVAFYTETCLEDVGRQGLELLGEQGGYIYPDLVGKYSAGDPTNADGINLEPLKVPYWHYNMEKNGQDKAIVFSSIKPALHADDDPEMSIEVQLSRFTEEKINDCLNDYSVFDEQGISVETQDTAQAVQVQVGETGVTFLMEKDLVASRGEESIEMDSFFIKIPLRLKHYYEVASQITEVEQNTSFVERQALDLLNTFGRLDAASLPPMEQVTFDPVPTVMWAELEVKEKVKRMLLSNVPLMRYLGSDNFYRYEYQHDSESAVLDLHELYQKNYDNMILPLDLGQKVNVGFDYFGWEPYFDMNDKAGMIRPTSQTVSWELLNFATNHYYSTYDISYPVLVTVRDDTAFDGEGYKFSFALEANIRNNRVVEDGDTQPPPIVDVDESMACNEDQWDTDILKTVVVDSANLEPIEAVQIGFSIPNVDDCIMGVTDSIGELESEYPAVYGGVSSFIKTDYLNAYYPLDTYELKNSKALIGSAVAGAPAERVIPLHKYKTINVTIKKKSLHKCIGDDCYGLGVFADTAERQELFSVKPTDLDKTHRWVYPDIASNLDEDEEATVILQRVGSLVPDVVYGDVISSATVKGSGSGELRLVPGIYRVNGLVTREGNLTIPEEERCPDGVFADCYTLAGQTMDQLLIGNSEWTENGLYLAITPEQLYYSQEIVFYILSFDLESVPEVEHIRVVDDLQLMGQVGNLSKQPEVRATLEPTFR